MEFRKKPIENENENRTSSRKKAEDKMKKRDEMWARLDNSDSAASSNAHNKNEEESIKRMKMSLKAEAEAKAKAEEKAKAEKEKAEIIAKIKAISEAKAKAKARENAEEKQKANEKEVTTSMAAATEAEPAPAPTPTPTPTPAPAPVAEAQSSNIEQDLKKQRKEQKRKAKEAKRKEKQGKKAAGTANAGQKKGILSSLEGAAAATIEWHDRQQEKFHNTFGGGGEALVREFHDASMRYKGGGKKMMRGFFSVVLITCILLVIFEKNTVYEYAYNGRALGYVNSQNTVVDILGVAGKQISKKNNVNINFKTEDNITLKKVAATNKDTDDADQVLDKLTYMTDVEVKAVGIYENGKLSTIVENQSTADKIIQKIREKYAEPDKGMEVKSADYKYSIETKSIEVMSTSIQGKTTAQAALENGGNVEIKHIVKEGETIDSLSKDYNTDKTSFTNAKTGGAIDSVEAGSMISVKKEVKPVTFELVEDGTMSEIVPFEVVKQNDAKMYKGDTLVKQKGVDGKQTITGKVTKENGKIVKRDIKKTEVITPMQKQIVLVGTSKRPKTAPTGKFAYPIRTYTITSYFGSRWGRMHEGIDFAAGTGTPIYASDGGTIQEAGDGDAYGNMVIIDHGSGRKTLYGHCSKLLVSTGEKVYQGQEIALVGSTGRSTGPHLHFEIHLNGSVVDPMKYL